MPSTDGGVQFWLGIAMLTVTALGLIVTIARAGAGAVRSQAILTTSVGELAKSVGRIDEKVEGYIASESRRGESAEGWRRGVDARLSSIEGSIASLNARSGRRRADRRDMP